MVSGKLKRKSLKWKKNCENKSLYITKNTLIYPTKAEYLVTYFLKKKVLIFVKQPTPVFVNGS